MHTYTQDTAAAAEGCGRSVDLTAHSGTISTNNVGYRYHDARDIRLLLNQSGEWVDMNLELL